MSNLTDEQIESMKKQAASEVAAIVQQMENDYPGIHEGLAVMLGSAVGAKGSLIALTLLGVKGLSAAGITSGLAVAGHLFGGGMVAGIGVLAAPIAVAGVAGYAIVKKRKNAKRAYALKEAIIKLYKIQELLMQNREDFKDELDQLKIIIKFYENNSISKLKLL